MRRLSALGVGLLFSLALAGQVSAAPQSNERDRQNRDRVCFYQDINYVGWEQCYVPGDEIRSLGNRKAAASSLRIFGRARVVVWDDTDFNGRTTEFTSDVPDLQRRAASGGHTWNDRISSVRVFGEGAYPYSNTAPPGNSDRNDTYRNDRYDNNGRVNNGVCVYDRPNYQGRSQCWEAGQEVNDLGGWSNRISSIRVFGHVSAVLYRSSGFRGDHVMINRDVPDLAALSGGGWRRWDNEVSSLEIADLRYPGRGYGRGRDWR
jgi:hypothetical protein